MSAMNIHYTRLNNGAEDCGYTTAKEGLYPACEKCGIHADCIVIPAWFFMDYIKEQDPKWGVTNENFTVSDVEDAATKYWEFAVKAGLVENYQPHCHCGE